MARDRHPLIAGCLSALLSHVGNRRLIARELRCSAGGSPHCSFVVVAQARKKALDELLAAGHHNVSQLAQRLSSPAPVGA